MDCSDGEGSGLLVGVVQFVEVLVQEGHVVDAVVPVRDVVLHDWTVVSGKLINNTTKEVDYLRLKRLT